MTRSVLNFVLKNSFLDMLESKWLKSVICTAGVRCQHAAAGRVSLPFTTATAFIARFHNTYS